ncbi:MAG: shikimate kinase [Candidatus Korarchaeota archaeon]|nr:shikimate kinase [Candidatus Korarchaeota archaeon]
MVEVRVNGAITVVNAIASWKGAAISIDFEVRARAEPSNELEVEPGDPLVREAALLALKEVGGDGVRVRVDSEIPAGWGLKSSSAVANAVVLSVMALHGRRDLFEALKISVKAARSAGVTITGALDDAAASMLGGFVMTDNSRDELVMRAPIKEMEVLVLLPESHAPKSTIEVDTDLLRSYAGTVDSIFSLLPRRIWDAMTLNGLLYSLLLGYDPSPALEAVRLGALGAGLSGTGPAVAAVCESCEEIEEAWFALGRVIKRRITNRRARIRE